MTPPELDERCEIHRRRPRHDHTRVGRHNLPALVRLPFGYRTVVVLHDIEQRLRRGRMMLVTALGAGGERRERLEGVPMRCWDARRHVSDYLDGALDAETSATRRLTREQRESIVEQERLREAQSRTSASTHEPTLEAHGAEHADGVIVLAKIGTKVPDGSRLFERTMNSSACEWFHELAERTPQ